MRAPSRSIRAVSDTPGTPATLSNTAFRSAGASGAVGMGAAATGAAGAAAMTGCVGTPREPATVEGDASADMGAGIEDDFEPGGDGETAGTDFVWAPRRLSIRCSSSSAANGFRITSSDRTLAARSSTVPLTMPEIRSTGVCESVGCFLTKSQIW